METPTKFACKLEQLVAQFLIVQNYKRMEQNQRVGELIPINESNGKRAVNARMLHAFLESKQQFQDWIKNRINKYGFVENQDFVSFHKIMKRETGATRVTEYAISVEMAKELSMVENNEKGRIARQYFIRCEEIATNKKVALPKDYPSALRELADKVEENTRLELENKQKDNQIKKLQPKADFADAAFKAEGNVDIGQAAKILNLPFGRNTLFRKLREGGVFFANKNEPKQRFVQAGYFILTQLPPIKRKNHPDIIAMKCICTQKGLAYINLLFGGEQKSPVLAKIK